MNEAFRPTDVMQQGMMDPNPGMQGMPNAMDGGTDTKVELNNQQQRAQQLLAQKMRADVQTAAPQAAADAMRMQEKEFTEKAGVEAKTMNLKNDYVVRALEQLGAGNELLGLNATLQSPERAQFVSKIEGIKAQFAGEDPDLGAYDASTQQYMA